MKYIKLYEELDKKRLDHNYIKLCFIDMIDSNILFDIESELDKQTQDFYGEGPYPLYIPDINTNIEINTSSYISLSLNFSKRTHNSTLDEKISELRERLNILLDVENCIKKVLMKYNNINYCINDEYGYEEVIIYYKW